MADRHAREKARWRGRMRLGRLAFWLIALACCLAPPAFAACVLGKVAELPVEMAGTRPLVTAKINGAEVKFLADSGAFFSMITPATATQFNLKRHPEFGLTIRGVGGDVTPSVATVDRLTLAGVDVPRVDFLVGGGEPGAGAVGIFGQNVLGLADVEYDLANGVIRLVQPRGCGDSALAYWAGSTPFSTIGIQPPPNAPVLDRLTPLTTGFAYVDGQKIRVVFDTGASTSVLSLKAAAGIGITPTTTGVVDAGLAQGIGRHMVSSWIAPIASFRIGGEEIKNTRLRIGAAGLDDIDMLLGADFFLSHRVYVANRQHKLYFTYNGGPVFRLDDATLVQAGQNQAPQASPVVADDKAAPTDAEGFARRAAALASRRDFDLALADLDHAIALSPKEASYYEARGAVHLEKHQPILAMHDFEAALTLKPDDVPALVYRAGLRRTAHDEAGAKADLKAASAAAPKEADIRLDLASAYLQISLPAEAIGELDLWIAAHGDDGRQSRARGLRCLAKGLENIEPDKALKDCDAALKLGGKSSSALDARGLIFIRLGQFDNAIADFSAALAIDPKEAWSLYGRGVAKIKKGMAADGKADIAAATALKPDIAEEARKEGLTP